MADTSVVDLMTENVLTVDRSESPGALAEAMVELEVKSVVVVDGDDRPEGIITSTDFLRMVDEGVDPGGTTVGEWMTPGVVTVRYDATVREAAGVMNDHGVGHLPVVDADGHAVGILSGTDLTAHVAGP
jgi:CBS domain-containing protein